MLHAKTPGHFQSLPAYVLLLRFAGSGKHHQMHTQDIVSPVERPQMQIVQVAHPIEGRQGGFQDRKSTRLNSSHVRISYAVFCLKKKTGSKRHPAGTGAGAAAASGAATRSALPDRAGTPGPPRSRRAPDAGDSARAPPRA